MLRSRPEWLSAATSTLAYGVRKAGAPAVDVCSCDSHFAAAWLGCSGVRSEQAALPPVK